MVKRAGVNASYEERWEVIRRIENKESVRSIAKNMGRTEKFVRRWRDRKDEVLKEGSIHSKHKGVVGAKPMFNSVESASLSKKLMNTTQIRLADKVGCSTRTLRKYTRKKKENPNGSFPYDLPSLVIGSINSCAFDHRLYYNRPKD